jgi:GTP cyclohydrolase II
VTDAPVSPLAVDGTLIGVEARPLATAQGDFTVHVFRNVATWEYALVLARGDVTTPAPLLARVHSSCATSESNGSCDCDCAEQLDSALAHVAHAGRGVLFYLMQEGRGAGICAKARDRMIVQASGNRLTTFEAYERMGLGRDLRRYDEVASACRLLGITAPLELLTNNPDKVEAIESEGIRIAALRPLRRAASAFNVHYLAAKARAGHTLGATAGGPDASAPPEAVVYADPAALPQAPHLLRMASYLLPIAVPEDGRPDGPYWLRLHAYLDLDTGAEWIVMTRGRTNELAPLVRVQPETLLERFAGRDGGPHRRRWHATVRAFARHGAGCAVFVPRDDLCGSAAGERRVDDTALRLLAEHVPSGRARPVLAGPDDEAAEPALRAALARHGIAGEPPLVLGGDV